MRIFYSLGFDAHWYPWGGSGALYWGKRVTACLKLQQLSPCSPLCPTRLLSIPVDSARVYCSRGCCFNADPDLWLAWEGKSELFYGKSLSQTFMMQIILHFSIDTLSTLWDIWTIKTSKAGKYCKLVRFPDKFSGLHCTKLKEGVFLQQKPNYCFYWIWDMMEEVKCLLTCLLFSEKANIWAMQWRRSSKIFFVTGNLMRCAGITTGVRQKITCISTTVDVPHHLYQYITINLRLTYL